MASALWGKYVSEVLKEVKFKYDHNGIRQELIEHMEELYEEKDNKINTGIPGERIGMYDCRMSEV